MSDIIVGRGKLRWAILSFISISHVVGASAQYGINTLAPFYQHELALSHAQVGLFFSAFYLAMTCASFIAGRLVDHLGVRKTVLHGHVAIAVFTIIASFAPSFTWGFASFFFVGIGYSFLNPASSKGVMEWFNRDRRATAMGIKQTGVPVGGVLTALLAGALVLIASWRVALATLGMINLVYGCLFAVLWRDPAKQVRDPVVAGANCMETRVPLDLRNLIPASFGTAMLLVGQMVLITYLPLYLKQIMGISAYWASQALAVAQMGAVLGRIGWGLVSDRLFGGRRKVVLLIIGVSGALLLGALSLMTVETPLWVVLTTIFLSGLCLVGYQGVSFAFVGELAGTMRAGVATGIMISINAAGAALGTPLFGYIVDRTDSYFVAWQILAGAIAVGVVGFTALLREPRSAL